MENSDEEKLSELRRVHYRTYESIYSRYKPYLETSTDNNQNYLFEEIPFFFFRLK